MKNIFRSLFSRSGRGDGERGAVLLIVAGTMVAVLLAGAVAVDLSVVASEAQSMQNASDAAALAGVTAYRDSGGDPAAAEAAVEDLLKQNGVDVGGSVNYSISYPDGVNDTEVTVTITNSDPDLFLAGVTGVVSDIERSATARFERCSDDCFREIDIPAPFSSVNAEGEGDGYKPIPVGNKLYALNHNSSDGHIVCVDRLTEAPCWQHPVTGSHTRYAYASAGEHNPEMPHAGVVGTRLYWTTSGDAGTHLYCWDSTTDSACGGTYKLNSRTRGTSLDYSNRKDRNRGGGTVAVDGLVYAFTDDHRVHCFDPTIASACSGYQGGALTALGYDDFPNNDYWFSNSGSSIDRIVDDATGRIYSTIHVQTPVATSSTGLDCSTPLADPRGWRVVIQNKHTGDFIYDDQSNDLEVDDNPDNEATQWYVRQERWDHTVTMRNVHSGRVMDSDGEGSDVDTSSSISSDDNWLIAWDSATETSVISSYADDGFLRDPGGSDDLRLASSTDGNRTRWEFWPAGCEDANAPALPTNSISGTYAAGTWMHCWDTKLVEPCANFGPQHLHTNGQRFSGRMFFFNEPRLSEYATPVPESVCSTGFDGKLLQASFGVTCVDMLGDPDPENEDDLEQWVTNTSTGIASTVNSSPAAWGDPHSNHDENRLFYPSQHGNSKVFCWDFDDGGSCGRRTGATPLGTIEDYGFFSEGNCVYGLGHNSIFWAFHAEDIDEPCTGSKTKTTIAPCQCDVDDAWGTLVFEVDLTLFDAFLVEIFDSSGTRVVPEGPDDPTDPNYVPGHSLHDHGIEIDLNHLPVGDPLLDFLTIEVSVEAENDPWAQGEQNFAVLFERAPRLVD